MHIDSNFSVLKYTKDSTTWILVSWKNHLKRGKIIELKAIAISWIWIIELKAIAISWIWIIELKAIAISWIWIFLEETKLSLVLKALRFTDQKFGTLYQLGLKLQKIFMPSIKKWNGGSCNYIVWDYFIHHILCMIFQEKYFY